jgi:hypothetical protein
LIADTLSWGEHPESDIVIHFSTAHEHATAVEAKYKGSSYHMVMPYRDAAELENALHCFAVCLHLNLAEKVIHETNSKSQIVYIPYDVAYGVGFEDMERRVPNIELINELIGWKPQRDLSMIIADISAEMKKFS